MENLLQAKNNSEIFLRAQILSQLSRKAAFAIKIVILSYTKDLLPSVLRPCHH